MCLKFWDLFPSKNGFRGFLSSANLVEWSLFISFPRERTNFPWEDINCHSIGILVLLSQLETSVRLVADYSKYPRTVAGGISKWLVPTLFAALPPKQYNTPTLIPPATQAKSCLKKGNILVKIYCRFHCLPTTLWTLYLSLS